MAYNDYDYTGSFVITLTDCTALSATTYVRSYCTLSRGSIISQKKNPFTLRQMVFLVPVVSGKPLRKKESFKKASQVVISRV